ncbi:MAG: hypothetical protein GY711_25255 [bacterium]|nr:hypothetical protein [bacterium]
MINGTPTTLAACVLLSLSACGTPDSVEAPSRTEPKTEAQTEPQPQPEPTAAAPTEAPPDTAVDPAEAGRAFYEANACAACHLEGSDGPSLVGLDAALLLASMDGTTPHTGGEVDGVTLDDAAALAAFLADQ